MYHEFPERVYVRVDHRCILVITCIAHVYFLFVASTFNIYAFDADAVSMHMFIYEFNLICKCGV